MTMKLFQARFSPYMFKNSKSALNRVLVPPMASETADGEGCVTGETLAHYQKIAESGAGIVMVEYTFVDPSGKSEGRQLGISTQNHVQGLSQLAQAIKASGALAGIQLTHSGGKSTQVLTQGLLMAPSSIPTPIKDRVPETPKEMTDEDIQLWKESFLAGASRAVMAGFDLVELHAAHGYGLNQFISPLTNQRSDDYGGSYKQRTKLLFEIAESIRLKFPRLILSVRMPGQDLMEGGLSVDDSIQIAIHLEKIGVDLVHVSSGIGGWRRPKERVGEGYLLKEAELIQKKISVPVIAVGGFQSIDFIEHTLQNSLVQFVAVGRAILADPRGWKESVMLQGNSVSHSNCPQVLFNSGVCEIH